MQLVTRRLRAAFAVAHAAVYEALRAAVPEARVVPAEAGGGTDGKGGGEFLLGWIVDEDEDDEDGRWDAVDGGTTATVAVVLRGTTLVLGCVGDSSAALLARDDDSGAAAHELLMEEHGPTHLAEYARLREVAAAEDMQWVYDCPGGEQVPSSATEPTAKASRSSTPTRSAAPTPSNAPSRTRAATCSPSWWCRNARWRCRRRRAPSAEGRRMSTPRRRCARSTSRSDICPARAGPPSLQPARPAAARPHLSSPSRRSRILR